MAAPVFETAPRRTPRRLLLVSYHFPPDPAVGGTRWQKLARYAAERGWGLDVVTLDPSDLAQRDVERLEDLPGGVRVYGVGAARLRIETAADRAWSVFRGGSAHGNGNGTAAQRQSRRRADAVGTFEKRDVKRAYFAWLEYARGRRWARRATARALSVLQPGLHRVVVTSGPPHMVHEAGRRISRATGLPFVADLRDPWRLVQRLPESIASPLWYALAAFYERRMVQRAALIVANTEPHRHALRAVYPAAADRIITVPNGCDDDALPLPEPRIGSAARSRFVVAYAGTIYLDRDPRPLLRAAARVIAQQRLVPDEFGIELMGEVERFDGVSVKQIAAEEGIARYVRLHPRGTRREALRFLSQAQLLVVLPQDSDLAIPAKMFDYMRCDAWVLALARRDCAVELLLRGSAADVVAPDDVPAIADLLGARVAQYRAGARPQRLSRDPRYGRRAMADRLFEAIEALTCAAS
ncbi:MAG TPA: glycosyltransferase [Gemmatimonadales bacterium]|jgi:glycosyltransferase involved in cell wall biosynthesis